MAVDYPDAIDMMLPLSYSFSSVAPLSIVCHKTGGDAHLENVQSTFLATMRSTHFAVDTDGRVAQFVPLERGAGGNCCADATHDGYWDPYIQQYSNLNFCTISIEHCDPTGNNSNPMPQAQIDASNKLIAWLCKTYQIDTNHIKGHSSINPIQKPDCPGSTFDFQQLFTYINQGGSMAPTGWKDDGTTLTAPNGVPVVKGFRDYILNNSWDARDVPLAAEEAVNPVEIGFSQPDGDNSGSRQIFMYSELGWTSSRGVFRISVGREFWTLLRQGQIPATIAAIAPALQNLRAAIDAMLKVLGV